MSDALLVLNAGSSSLKFALYPARGPLQPRLRAELEPIGAAARLKLRGGDIDPLPIDATRAQDHAGAIDAVLGALAASGHTPCAVGHRVVHGGRRFDRPQRVDAALLDGLRTLAPLAPLHQPFNLAAIEAVAERLPGVPQVACFDTAFHRRQPAIATWFALPRALHEQGVQRYGFHGLSYEYVIGALAECDPSLAAGRVVVAHLGSGASLCALDRGVSIATSMGFSALDGVPMGTRCGALDPGVVLHLLRQPGMDVDAVETLLSRRAGLLGVSGISADVRDLLASPAPEAAEALELFCYRVNRELGGLVAALGGIDALVFTGGIGEHAAPIRARIAALAGWCGLVLDPAANADGRARIDAAGSRVQAWVIATDEEQVIARATRSLLAA